MKKLTIFAVILFTLFAVILNFIPHLNYPYPLHVDEWVHFQYANHLSNDSPLYFNQNYNSLERGFHTLLAVLNSIGIPYLFIFRFFPSLITILICLSIFILTRRIWNETAGVFSILFIALLSSSVMILGPVFLVPMAVGMFLITIGLFLVEINSKYWFLILTALLIIHPPSAMAFLLLININFLLNRKDYLKKIYLQILAGILALPLYFNIFLSKGLDTLDYLAFTPFEGLFFIPRLLGYVITGLFIIGIYLLAKKKKYEWIWYFIGLIIFIIIFYWFETEFFIPYRRALMYLFLIFAVIFGIGCDRVINLSQNKIIRAILIIMLLELILFSSLPNKIKSNDYYYQIMNNEDFKAFEYISENTDKNAVAIVDSWKANAFTPIAERSVYSRLVQGPSIKYETRNKEIIAFFNNKCQDTTLLKENNISIIYGDCSNPSLTKIYNKTYLCPKWD